MQPNNKFILTVFFILLCLGKTYAETWVKKANFGGAGRYSGIGFSIGAKGYIGLGNDNNLVEYNDFWEWDQATDTWTQKSNFPDKGREQATGFSIGNKGYVGLGGDVDSVRTDFWEWNQSNNTWTKKANFPGSKRIHAVGFSIGVKGYIGVASYTQDFWEWDQLTNSWTQKANFGGGPRGWATGFSIGKKGYIGTGTDGSYYKRDFWEWDGDPISPSYNTWKQKADLVGGARTLALGFSVGSKGYIALGLDSTTIINLNDFWEWDSSNNTWTQKLNFGGAGRQSASGFSINNKGYIGIGGYGNTSAIDFWEYCDTCTVGIDELSKQINISVFPNPSSGAFTLQSNVKAEITIYSISGERIFSKQVNSEKETIDLSNQNEGVYFLNFKTDKGSITKKIILQH